MGTEDCGLREVVGGATVEELRGVLLALEGQVIDVGKPYVSEKYMNTHIRREPASIACSCGRPARKLMLT